MTRKCPGIGDEYDVIIPIVGECDDSWLNDAVGRHVRSEHVYRAIEQATAGPVAEGSVGAGTGLITCDFKAGIGTSSRRVADDRAGPTTPWACWCSPTSASCAPCASTACPSARSWRPTSRRAQARAQRRLDHLRGRHRRAAVVVAARAPVQARGARHRPRRLVRRARLGRDHRRLLDRQQGAALDLGHDRHDRGAARRRLRPALRGGGRVHRGGDRQRAVHGRRHARPVGDHFAPGAAARPALRDPAEVPRRPSGRRSARAMRDLLRRRRRRAQQATFSGIYLALAAHRRGHDVRFVSRRRLSRFSTTTTSWP